MAAASRSTSNSLLRVSQACETLLAGFNSGKAATIKSCLVSRQHAVSVSERNDASGAQAGSDDAVARGPSDSLLPLETAMANRRTRPSLLLPAWRAVGFAVGSSATVLLSADAFAKVEQAIGRAVAEQYDANIRFMYETRVVQEESEVKELFKAQRDEPWRAALTLDGGDGNSAGDSSGMDVNEDADKGAENADKARKVAIEGTLKSALRMACTVTAKI